MSEMIDGEEWITQTEATQLLGWVWQTFRSYSAGLSWQTLPGRGIRKYYRKADVLKLARPQSESSLESQLADVARAILRNTSMDELPPSWQILKQRVIAEGKKLEG